MSILSEEVVRLGKAVAGLSELLLSEQFVLRALAEQIGSLSADIEDHAAASDALDKRVDALEVTDMRDSATLLEDVEKLENRVLVLETRVDEGEESLDSIKERVDVLETTDIPWVDDHPPAPPPA